MTATLDMPVLSSDAIREEIGPERLRELYRRMLLIRRFEEKCTAAVRQKKVAGFLHLYIGQEAIATGFYDHVDSDTDYTVTSYRDHAQPLLLGVDPRELMAELFGRVTGNVRGKGGSMHFFSAEKKFLGGHGIVGGQIPIGTGGAFACKYRGTRGVSLTHMGDGGCAQGTFHESLNMASLWDLPAIYIIENNEWGMGTATNRAVSVKNIAEARAQGYNIQGFTIDGTDLYQCWKAGQQIIGHVRDHSRPVLVEAKTVRFVGHSGSDAQPYRSRDDISCLRQNRDVLKKVATDLLDCDWATEAELDAIEAEVKAVVQDSWDYADASPIPPMSELKRHVLAHEPWED
ncbi:MAG: pyruvate dehydrogenase (acetyl-transferring) E1 component subunit alpha [Planctomycetota bacterium]|jgi:pyruvate dehydrogenase E1 component alpha subunit